MKKKKIREDINTMHLNKFDEMSDEELQEAFAAGVIKPGLNVLCEEKKIINNVPLLNLKLEETKLNLKWIERLDLISAPAPMPPEAYEELVNENKDNIVNLKSRLKLNGMSKELVMDDFEREMLFYRQAQSAVLEGIKRLKDLGIPTKRPDDYFAEMAKSDEHMHKVRENLAARQATAARAEKVKQLRRLKKLGKQTQIINKQKQESEKKKMLNEVKKFKKGLRKDLNFLENNPSKGPGKSNLTKPSAKALRKKMIKDKKFGYGGKKKGSKKNTRESVSDIGSFRKKGKKPGGHKAKRMGKSKRIKKRARK